VLDNGYFQGENRVEKQGREEGLRTEENVVIIKVTSQYRDRECVVPACRCMEETRPEVELGSMYAVPSDKVIEDMREVAKEIE
jgi:hypothetical protein